MATNAFGDQIEAPAQAGRVNAFGDPIESVAPGYQRLAAAGKYTDPNPPQSSPIEQIGHSIRSQAKGLFDLISSIGDPEKGMQIGDAAAEHVTDNWKKAKEAYSKGDYLGALGHAGQAIPIVGQMIDKSSSDIAEGRPYEAATDVALAPLLAKGAGALGDAAASAPGAAVRAATAEAGAQVRPVLSGVNLIHPLKTAPLLYDAGAAIVNAGKQGAKDFVTRQDLAARAAANTGKVPVWQGIQPEVRPTPGQPVAIPSTLQSGKVPGGPQNIPPPPAPLPPRVPAWEGIPNPQAQPITVGPTGIQGVLPSGRVPGPAPQVAPVVPAPRIPAWERLKQSLGEAAPIADAPIDIPNALPSGRVPGGVHNQELPVEQQLAPPEVPPAPAALPSPVDKFRELQKSAKAAKAPEPSAADQLLDGIAQGYGFKKGFKAVKDPTVQQTIRDLATKMGQAKPEAAPVAPEPQSTNFYEYDPAKDPSAFGQQLATAFDRLKAKGPLLTKPDPGDGPYRFEEGSGEAPVIDSSKTRGNRPVANPSLLKPGQPEAMADTLQKIANPTEGQKALLKQLREEIKRRGTQ